MDNNNLRRLAQKATPGPWKLNAVRRLHVTGRGWNIARVADGIHGDGTSEANAAFIAAANPAAILALLDERDAAIADADAALRRLEEAWSAANQMTTLRDAARADAARMREAMERIGQICDGAAKNGIGWFDGVARIARAALVGEAPR